MSFDKQKSKNIFPALMTFIFLVLLHCLMLISQCCRQLHNKSVANFIELRVFTVRCQGFHRSFLGLNSLCIFLFGILFNALTVLQFFPHPTNIMNYTDLSLLFHKFCEIHRSFLLDFFQIFSKYLTSQLPFLLAS